MTDFQVDCITKPNRDSRHEAISHLGGLNPNGSRWYVSAQVVISHIKSGDRFYTLSRNGLFKAFLEIVPRKPGYYDEHVRTKPDGTNDNNLLQLNSCPI